jgi:hypothetical protein
MKANIQGNNLSFFLKEKAHFILFIQSNTGTVLRAVLTTRMACVV